MDYSPRSGTTGAGGAGGSTGELEVKKGAQLRILKRYNHWSYAIKEDGGRGWVPSWFVFLSVLCSLLPSFVRSIDANCFVGGVGSVEEQVKMELPLHRLRQTRIRDRKLHRVINRLVRPCRRVNQTSRSRYLVLESEREGERRVRVPL